MLYSDFVKQNYNAYKNDVSDQRAICDVVSKFDIKRSFKMRKCANSVIIAVNGNSSKVVYGEYCNDRLCPICQAALHRERSSKLSFMVNECVKKGYTPYFWTFSPAVNCKLENLKETSRAIINVVNRVIKTYFTKEHGVIGWWRTLEFTDHSNDSFSESIEDNTSYHPHIHILFMYDHNYITPYVKDISKFIIDEVNNQLKLNLKSKTQRSKFDYYKYLEGTKGIVYAERVNTSNPGFAFELSKYISVSKKCNVANLKLFSTQIQSLQCHRSTGVLLWSDDYKEDYKAFIQNENYELFNGEYKFYLFTDRKDGFRIREIPSCVAKDYIKEYQRYLN